MVFGIMCICVIDVVRTQFTDAFGIEPRTSVVFVALVIMSLLSVYTAYPDWE